MFAFWRTPGAPDTVKYDTVGPPGALSQNTHTLTIRPSYKYGV